MPRCPSWPSAALILILGLAPVVAAQQTESPEELRLRELKFRLLEEGPPRGDQAAMDLFTTGRLALDVSVGPEGAHDTFLRDVMLRRDVYKTAARECILRALRICGRFRAEAACRLVQEGLDDPQVAQLAIGTFPTIDDERGATYRFLENRLVELRRARSGSREHKQALGLIEALERMPNPIEAVGVLVTVLEQARLSRALEMRVREALTRMTAQSFETAGAWRTWYDGAPTAPGARQRSLAEWRLEVARKRDDRLRRYESEAERYFGKLLASYQNDKEALYRELQAALNDAETVFAVRRATIRELGTLGKRGEERAVSLLRTRLAQPSVGGGAGEYDETKAIVIEALGETGNKALLDDVVPYLRPSFHVRMRIAAAGALGALQAPDAVEHLLKVLGEVNGPHGSTPPDELLEVVVDALGRVQTNPDGGADGRGKVSGALMDFVRTLRGGTNGGPTATASLLAIVAKSLGALPYSPGGPEAERVTNLLVDLVAHEDANVRFFAASALGGMPHAAAFPALTDRLPLEAAVHVRKSLLDSIGQQALDHPDLIPDAMRLLAPFLEHAEEQLRRKARQRLEELAGRPPSFRESFVGLEMLVAALRHTYLGKASSLAVPFLTGQSGLPALDALTPAQAPHRTRYLELLEVRATGQIETDAQAALNDFTTVIQALDMGNPTGAKARGLHLGKARALLRLTPPRAKDALQTVTACFPPAQGEDGSELWAIALEAAERLKESDPGAVPPLLLPLQQYLTAAPSDAQRRYAALVGP